jgi:hypothetical protein
MMELDAISEKLKRVEQQLVHEAQVDKQVSSTDFYSPLIETQCEQPPKKRMKCSR